MRRMCSVEIVCVVLQANTPLVVIPFEKVDPARAGFLR